MNVGYGDPTHFLIFVNLDECMYIQLFNPNQSSQSERNYHIVVVAHGGERISRIRQ